MVKQELCQYESGTNQKYDGVSGVSSHYFRIISNDNSTKFYLLAVSSKSRTPVKKGPMEDHPSVIVNNSGVIPVRCIGPI